MACSELGNAHKASILATNKPPNHAQPALMHLVVAALLSCMRPGAPHDLLPAVQMLGMPWCNRLWPQAEVAETGAAVALTASNLSEAVALLPGAPACLGSAPLAAAGPGAELARRGAEVAGGRDAWLWAGLGESDSDEGGQQGAAAPGGKCHPCNPQQSTCFVDVSEGRAACAAAIARSLKGRGSGHTRCIPTTCVHTPSRRHIVVHSRLRTRTPIHHSTTRPQPVGTPGQMLEPCK